MIRPGSLAFKPGLTVVTVGERRARWAEKSSTGCECREYGGHRECGSRTLGSWRGVKCGAIGTAPSRRGPLTRPADLQRYKRLLLEKQRELSFFQAEANGLVPAAGGSEGDIVDQANADAE